jgi:hypothetical protein
LATVAREPAKELARKSAMELAKVDSRQDTAAVFKKAAGRLEQTSNCRKLASQ